MQEGYMAIMNSVILDNQPRMQRFLEKLIGVADTDSPDTQATLATFPLQTDLHTARCRLLAALYSNRNAVLPALMNTPTPVPGWTPPARMSLSGNSASVASRGDSDRKNSEPVAPTNDRDDKSAKGTLGEMLGQLLDAYRVHCPDWVRVAWPPRFPQLTRSHNTRRVLIAIIHTLCTRRCPTRTRRPRSECRTS
jgi:hypothetical protein